jgi:hypothetical protein
MKNANDRRLIERAGCGKNLPFLTLEVQTNFIMLGIPSALAKGTHLIPKGFGCGSFACGWVERIVAAVGRADPGFRELRVAQRGRRCFLGLQAVR